MNDKLGLSCAKLRLDENVDTIEDTEEMESNQDYEITVKIKRQKLFTKTSLEGGPALDRPASQMDDDEGETETEIDEKIDVFEIEEDNVKENEGNHTDNNENDNIEEERKAISTETKIKLLPIFQAAKNVGNVTASRSTLAVHTQKPHVETNDLNIVQEAFNPLVQEEHDREAPPSHCILLTNNIFQEIEDSVSSSSSLSSVASPTSTQLEVSSSSTCRAAALGQGGQNVSNVNLGQKNVQNSTSGYPLKIKA